MEKTKAQHKYDDTIAKGDGAILLSEKDLMELNIGNLHPGQEAIVDITLI